MPHCWPCMAILNYICFTCETCWCTEVRLGGSLRDLLRSLHFESFTLKANRGLLIPHNHFKIPPRLNIVWKFGGLLHLKSGFQEHLSPEPSLRTRFSRPRWKHLAGFSNLFQSNKSFEKRKTRNLSISRVNLHPNPEPSALNPNPKL